jgi:hypothetical protein
MRAILIIAVLMFTNSLWAECNVSDIAIKSMKAGFVDECTRTPCIYMKGVAVLTSNCAESVGVQVKITGYDGSGAPLATRELWPASIRNISPGDYTFSLDQWLDYDPELKKSSYSPLRSSDGAKV